MDIQTTTTDKTNKTIAAYVSNLGKIRSGRAHAGLLDNILVNSYGTDMPLAHLATVAVTDARTLMVTVWDRKNTAAVEKSIRESDLGVNPAVVEHNIRVSIPVLSEERRRQLVKIVGKEAEDTRIAVRNIRRDILAELKSATKDKTISEDEKKSYEKEVQKIIDKVMQKIEQLSAEKQKELMTV